MKPGRGSHFRWDPVSNERFFKGLRLFGTDFLMIANMFPGLTRKQIKTKFIREENADKARVHECLRTQEQTNLEEYAEMASMETEEFQTLDSIQKELEEQERQLREEDNQRRISSTSSVEIILSSCDPSLLHIAPILYDLGIKRVDHLRAIARLSDDTRDREVKEEALKRGVTVVE